METVEEQKAIARLYGLLSLQKEIEKNLVLQVTMYLFLEAI